MKKPNPRNNEICNTTYQDYWNMQEKSNSGIATVMLHYIGIRKSTEKKEKSPTTIDKDPLQPI